MVLGIRSPNCQTFVPGKLRPTLNPMRHAIGFVETNGLWTEEHLSKHPAPTLNVRSSRLPESVPAVNAAGGHHACFPLTARPPTDFLPSHERHIPNNPQVFLTSTATHLSRQFNIGPTGRKRAAPDRCDCPRLWRPFPTGFIEMPILGPWFLISIEQWPTVVLTKAMGQTTRESSPWHLPPCPPDPRRFENNSCPNFQTRPGLEPVALRQNLPADPHRAGLVNKSDSPHK